MTGLKNRLKQAAWKHPALWEGYKFLRSLKRAWRIRFQLNPPLRILRLEITNKCNLACIMCGNHLITRTRGLMSRDVFNLAVGQLPDGSMETISVSAVGEPLLHPDLVYFLKAARLKAQSVFMSTNGLLFDKNEDFMAQVLRSGLNHVHFSAEGYDPETYERYRVGAKFDDFLANLKLFKKLRDRVNPKLHLHLFYCLAREHTTEEFHKIYATYADWVDEIEFSPLNNQANAKIAYRPDFEVYGYRYYQTHTRNACAQLWAEPTVLWDGRVSACSRNYAGESIMGDVRETSIFEIWEGERYRAIRLEHVGKRFLGKCLSCFELHHDVIERAYINRLIRKRANLPDMRTVD